MKDIYILAIESSCDETSMAIIKNGHECVALTILTQMDTHALYGGVVPEIASRMHVENITMVLDETLKKANMKIDQVNAVAVTYAPGLVGSLLVGVECAKTIAFLYNLPLIKVNHIAGHIYANNIDNTIVFPTLALVVSGGHTDLVIIKGDYDFEVLGSTLDDAVGECFDKVARVLDLKYPGGPNVQKLASLGKETYKLNEPMKDNSYNFSFSGLKSNVINLVNTAKMKNEIINKADLASSFQNVAIKSLIKKVELAINNFTEIKHLLLAGGVSANELLRCEMKNLANKYNLKLSVPDIKLCTDNAAMIGAAAYPLYKRKEFSNFDFDVESRTELF